ncbi:MAG: glycosyltransferase, partial [Nitrospiraceae bacterium]|nr:glycosyltransferase [Nitrospiraceae bacterium]
PPAVVRNIPDRIALDANAQTGWPLRLLFHGNIVANRGLEALIDSLEQWTTPHFLTIRGNGAKAYVDTLRQRVRNVRRSDFVRFEPAVHPDEVIPLAAETADCGVFFTPLDTLQQQFTMPNKLFEYISAGLAVAVSPAADMRDLVLGHDLGLVSENDGAEAIAATINSLTRESVDQFKAKARVAAQSLCWDAEKIVLKDALEWLISKTELP